MYQPSVEIQKSNLNKFCQEVEELINDLVQENYVLNWDEDFLTRKFLSQLTQRLNGSLITDLENRVVFLTPFKLTKPVEKKFGDIAIIVTIEFGDGDKIEGIAFLEAKRKYKESRNFDAIKWEQLERIYQNAPHSQLLLYDFRDISEFASTGLVSKKNATAGNPMAQLPVTKFVTAPINKAIQVRQNNERLYKLSLPVSYQLAYRYLNGFDLDFVNDKLKQVKSDFAKNYENVDLEIPAYLIYVSIVPDKSVKEDRNLYSKEKRMGYIPDSGIDERLYSKIKPNE
ncbi:MAG: hypothetical protein SFV22_00585 [Saprospiraceae bacterium]|nr:hypothetical protein [Saprospiraceae bacterium]